MEEGEEVASGFVIAGRDPSALLEPREESLDVISLAVQLLVVRALNFAIPLGRNDGLTSLIVDRLQHLVAIVALVGEDVFRNQSLQQRRGLSDVVRLAGREQKPHRVAETVAGRVDLRSESAARPTELLIPTFFRAPTA